MTKKDLNAVIKGAAVGGGIFALFWLFLRKPVLIRELNPAEVKWEGN